MGWVFGATMSLNVMRFIRLLKNSAQRANLRLNRSLAEEKRGTDWDIAAVTCSLKPHFACPTGFSTACYSV